MLTLACTSMRHSLHDRLLLVFHVTCMSHDFISATLQVYRGHSAMVRCIAVEPQGQWLASGEQPSFLVLWLCNSVGRVRSMYHSQCDIDRASCLVHDLVGRADCRTLRALLHQVQTMAVCGSGRWTVATAARPLSLAAHHTPSPSTPPRTCRWSQSPCELHQGQTYVL